MTKPSSLKSFSSRLLPHYVFENKPRFRLLIESFLEFIEQTHIKHGYIFHRPQELLSNLILDHDIDRTGRLVKPKNQISDDDVEYTVNKFFAYHKKTYLSGYPYLNKYSQKEGSFTNDNVYSAEEGYTNSGLSTEFTNLIKRIRNFYQAKGTVKSIDFFFKSVFNASVDITYPKDNILRLSDGYWFEPYYVRFAFYPKINHITETIDSIDPSLVIFLNPDQIDSLIGKRFYTYDSSNSKISNNSGLINDRELRRNLVYAESLQYYPFAIVTEISGELFEGDIVHFEEQVDFEIPTNYDIRIVSQNLPSNAREYKGKYDSSIAYQEGDIFYDSNEEINTPPDYYIVEDIDGQGTLVNQNLVSDHGGYANPEWIGIENRVEGSWIDRSGFLSDEMRLQDNHYYQDYSYVVRSNLPPGVWMDFLIRNGHPSGMEIFNILSFIADDSISSSFSVDLSKQWHYRWSSQVSYSGITNSFHYTNSVFLENQYKAIRLAPDCGSIEKSHMRYSTISELSEQSIDWYFRKSAHGSSLVFASTPRSPTDFDLSKEESIKLNSDFIDYDNNRLQIFRTQSSIDRIFSSYESHFEGLTRSLYNQNYHEYIPIRVFHLNSEGSYFRKSVNVTTDIIPGGARFSTHKDYIYYFQNEVEYSNFLDPATISGTMEITLDNLRRLVFHNGKLLNPNDSVKLIATKTSEIDYLIEFEIITSSIIENYNEIEIYILKTPIRRVAHVDLGISYTETLSVDIFNHDQNILVFEQPSGSDTLNLLAHKKDYSINKNHEIKINSEINSSSDIFVFEFEPYSGNLKRDFTTKLRFLEDSLNSFYNDAIIQSMEAKYYTNISLIPSHPRSKVFNGPVQSRITISSTP